MTFDEDPEWETAEQMIERIGDRTIRARYDEKEAIEKMQHAWLKRR